MLLAPLLLLSAPRTKAQFDPALTADEFQLAQATVAALRRGDLEALVELVDFPSRLAEGVARGDALVGWEELDELGQLLERKRTAEAWLGERAQYMRGALLFQTRLLADPDAGWGPVPRRRILQLQARDSSSRQLIDLLLVTANGALLDLTFGEPYPEGGNPLGPEGLQPRGRVDVEARGVQWPDDSDAFDREAAGELIDALLASERPVEQELVIERLHRSPRPAVAGLLERLVALDAVEPPDAVAQGLLVQALETITGRSSDFVPVPLPGMDEGAWRAGNHDEIGAWLRWHARHGGHFAAAPIQEPTSRTHDERLLAAGAGTPEPGGSAGVQDGAPDTRSAVDAPPPPGSEGTPPREPEGAPPAGTEGTPPATEHPPEAPEASSPGVVFRSTVAPARAPLTERAAALTLLWGEREVTASEVGEQIPASVRHVLESWAETIVALDLHLCLSGNADHVVMGRVADDQLVEAARLLDDAWELLDPLVPRLRTGSTRPVLALLYDDACTRDEVFWPLLVEALQSRRALLPAEADEMRRAPSGVMARGVPLLLQPTHDMAGNAAAGDDEFRLANELVHKFAQCLLTERCGQLPKPIRWGVGHLVELRLKDSVYQFDTTGFVASGDHFDWDRRGARLLEKRASKRHADLSDVLLGEGSTTDDAVLAWAVLESLSAKAPPEFSALLQGLAELHREADAYGLADDYRGDPERSRAVLDSRLQQLPVGTMLEHLESL